MSQTRAKRKIAAPAPKKRRTCYKIGPNEKCCVGAGGLIASLTGGHGDSGEEVTAAAGLVKYTDVFATIGWTCVGIAVLIALLNKPLNKLMHGVK